METTITYENSEYNWLFLCMVRADWVEIFTAKSKLRMSKAYYYARKRLEKYYKKGHILLFQPFLLYTHENTAVPERVRFLFRIIAFG